MTQTIPVKPSLEAVTDILTRCRSSPNRPNLVPLCATVPADLLNPTIAYLKLAHKSKLSFLYESAATTGTIGRFSFVGADPLKIIKTGAGHGPECDPLPNLERELAQFRVATVPELDLPSLIGGFIGYVGYDCVRYFEPKTARPMKDVLKVPESFFMLFDTIVAFDHFFQLVKIITYLRVPPEDGSLADPYDEASRAVQRVASILLADKVPALPQSPILRNQQFTSNIGQEGYEKHVKTLKKHISVGDIIQAVPSQRLARPTSLHPFSIFRHLRTVNPSPYLFYIDCAEFCLVGASPELLVKEEAGRIITHPIAGTIKRGETAEEDEQNAEELRNSLKDRAEHVMLTDLARNDINRVCDPLSTRVDRLMVVEKFSHVQHLVSQVSGVLREGQTRWDAFRSLFPAGTVSGAPKVKAMELIAELEGERRGVYAGAICYFGFSTVSADGESMYEGAMDTCIALRTMLVKDGVAYLQAGGGIVFDSDPYEEYVETMNKLKANIQCIEIAEEKYYGATDGDDNGQLDGAHGDKSSGRRGKAHIDLAAG